MPGARADFHDAVACGKDGMAFWFVLCGLVDSCCKKIGHEIGILAHLVNHLLSYTQVVASMSETWDQTGLS